MLRLSYLPPLHWNALVSFLCRRGSTHIEQLIGDCYLRTIKLHNDTGWIAATHDTTRHQIKVSISSSLLPSLSQLQMRLRNLFDLDANPEVIETHLKHDKTLRQLITQNPGLRVPGTFNFFELSLRAILGQQVTVKAATTLYGRFVETFGEPIVTPFLKLDRISPEVSATADAKLQTLINLGLTQRRALTIHQLAQKIAKGEWDLNPVNKTQIIEQLLELPGIDPWTAQYIAMRALGDPDAMPESDLGLMRALQLEKPAEVRHRAEKWQPWRAYGVIHLWHHLSTGN